MKISIILPIAALLLSFTMSNAQESPLPSELRKQISEWRMNALPTLTPEAYWSELKELGSRVGEVNARRIEASGSSDTDSAIALMAYDTSVQPAKAQEIASWYGLYEERIPSEQWAALADQLRAAGASEREVLQAQVITNPAMKTAQFAVKRLMPMHTQKEYLPAWEAWMLSPFSLQREIMRPRMNEALSAIGNKRSVAILVEKCRVLPEHVRNISTPENQQKSVKTETDKIRRIIRSIGGEAAVLGLLECVRIAEAKGYAGEGPDSIRNLVIYSLTSTYNPRELAANPEWEQSLRASQNAPATPGGLTPYDDKWKEFKPIIKAMLKDPKDLRAEDIRLLQDALAAMPKN